MDIRFVCATNKDPLQEVHAGRFREDLYYRLHVVPLNLPPLREREGDIELLANYFLQQFSERDGKELKSFSAEAIVAINAYNWPGNVRELQNAMQNTVVLNQGSQVERAMLPPSVLGIGQPVSSIASEPSTSEKVAQENQIPNLDVAQVSQVSGVAAASNVLANSADQIQPLWMAEKQIIQRAIDLCGGSVNKAAGKLEVAPSTLYRKIQAWNENQAAV